MHPGHSTVRQSVQEISKILGVKISEMREDSSAVPVVSGGKRARSSHNTVVSQPRRREVENSVVPLMRRGPEKCNVLLRDAWLKNVTSPLRVAWLKTVTPT